MKIVLFFWAFIVCGINVKGQSESSLKFSDSGSFPDYQINTRKFSGIPSVAVSQGGRIWSTWYAGKTPGEAVD